MSSGEPHVTYAQALVLNRAGKPRDAIALFEQGASAGHGPSCIALASILALGQFIDPNPARARDLLSTGYDAGDAACGLHLSAFIAAGVGGAKSWSDAVALLAEIAANGNAFATRELGLLFLLEGDVETAARALGTSARDVGAHGDAVAKALVRASLGRGGDGDRRLAAAYEQQLASARAPISLLSGAPEFSSDALNAPFSPPTASFAFSSPEKFAASLSTVHEDPWIAETTKAASSAILDYVILSAFPSLAPARIADPSDQGARRDPYRTGAAMNFSVMQQTPVLVAVREIMCALARAPLDRGEPLAVIAYQGGQEYKPHFDAFVPPTSDEGRSHEAAFKRGGQRTHTCLLYLNDTFEGGETEFPKLDVSISPRAGAFAVFSNVDADGARHLKALHRGAPVRSGVKLLASQWIRETTYETAPAK